MEANVITQGIGISGGVIAAGVFLIWLTFRIRRLKTPLFIVGILLLAWGAYLIFDFLACL